MNTPAFPALTDFEEKVFKLFERTYTPGYHPNGRQIAGDRQVAREMAARRLAKKGLLVHIGSAKWLLTPFGCQLIDHRLGRRSAPWSEAEVENLRKRQSLGWPHEYTCPECGAVLVPEPSGWRCFEHRTVQRWAHASDVAGDFPAEPVL